MSQYCTPETVITILYEKVGVPADTPGIAQLTWDELGIESLALTEIVSNLEQMLDITISQNDAMQTSSVRELVTMINARLEER